MDYSLTEYIIKVKSHLFCNLTNEEKMIYCSYDYTETEVDSNMDYFKDCYNEGLSPYKSLLFFDDYLKTKKYDIGTFV